MNELSLVTHDAMSLLGIDVKWNTGLFGSTKSVELTFSPDHAFTLNDYFKRDSIVLDLSDKCSYELKKFTSVYFTHTENGYSKELYFQCRVTNDGKTLVTLERILIKSSFLRKSTTGYRLGRVHMNGYVHYQIVLSAPSAERMFDNVVKVHNYAMNEYNSVSRTFDRFMRKYFSFYK